jgi:hypothetical protein
MFFTNGTNNEEIEIDDITYQSNIEAETILQAATVAAGNTTATLTSPAISATTLFKMVRFNTGEGSPPPACSNLSTQTPVTVQVNALTADFTHSTACVGQTANFSATVTNATPPYQYS